MLGYLDALIAALSLRDAPEAERLLGHPLARLLPEAVRDEAASFVRGDCDHLAAPLCAMRLRHQTAQLLSDAIELADQPERPEPRPAAVAPPTRSRRASRHHQMELPLSA